MAVDFGSHFLQIDVWKSQKHGREECDFDQISDVMNKSYMCMA